MTDGSANVEQYRPDRISAGVKLHRSVQAFRTLPLRRLCALAMSQWRRIALGSIFLLVSSGAGLLYPQAIRWIIDAAVASTDPHAIDQATAWMVLIFFIQGLATAARSYLFTLAGERIVADLRRALYNRLIGLDVAFFDAARTGDLLSRLASDTQVLQNTVSVNVSMAARNLALLIGGIAFLAWTSLKLTLFMLCIVPPVAIAAVYNGRRIRRYASATQRALSKATEVAEETLSGVRTVRQFTAEPHEKQRYGAAIETSFSVAKMRTKFASTFFGLTSFAGFAAVAMVVWHGGHLVLQGQISPGDLTSFVLYTLTIAFSLGALGGLWSDFMRAAGAAERVFELMDERSEMNTEQGQQLAALEGKLSMRGVGFTYPSRPDVQVLKEFDLTIAPGQIVALVGPSGGGKSTVAALLCRLYDPDEGEIFLDDVDIRSLNPDWLRRQIGTVSQEPLLFSTTIRDNILYGNPRASETELLAAAKAANAHDFITAFPDGYDTSVGERGVRLSGGQKQRIAIARALVKNPKILVLDEATSALDAESEHLVKEALERLMQGRTTLLIAHRLSTVKDADEVVVISDGRVSERGTHQELSKTHGLYRQLVDRQLVPL